jgi:phosphatidylinositol alpha-mannosyltransferase
MRVGLVCPYSLTVPGGVQAQVLGLARVLRRLGHEARVLAPCDGPPPELFVTPLGNSIPTAANGSMAPVAPDIAATLRTIRVLRDEEFDIVHLHEPLAPGPTLTALLMHPAPTVATFHAAGDSSSYRWLNPALGRFAARIDVRCAVSDDARLLAQRYLGGCYELVHNGVEVDRWRLAEPLKPDGPTVFFCGRHEPRKGLEVLLAAMAMLPPTTRCWVAGSGPDTARLQAQYAGDPRIEWLGLISDEEKIARMRGASVFCAPSLGGESFGVVLIEAMAARTPIVASNLPGYRNVARPDLDACLVPGGDPEALAAGLRLVLTDDDLAERLRTSGAERADTFSMDSLARRYLGFYQMLHRSELGRQMAERVRSRRGRRRNIPAPEPSKGPPAP